MRAAFSSKAAPIVALGLLAAPSIAAGAGDDLTGRAEVIDGDTIAIQGVEPRVRLFATDTPEGQQTCRDAEGAEYLCGSRAADALAALIGRSGRVSCHEQDRDRYGRIVAVCEADGRDIGGELVRQGWGLEYRAYSDGRYADEQAEAKQASRGLWGGSFVEPWAWRRGERLDSQINEKALIELTARRSCKSVSTCREAVIMWCNGYRRADGDNDGIPCENVCSSVDQVNAIRREIGC